MDRDIAKKVFTYFKNKVILDYADYSLIVVEESLKNNKEALLRLLKVVDSDIVDIKLKKAMRIHIIY